MSQKLSWNKVLTYIDLFCGSFVTMGWHSLRLQMEGKTSRHGGGYMQVCWTSINKQL